MKIFLLKYIYLLSQSKISLDLIEQINISSVLWEPVFISSFAVKTYLYLNRIYISDGFLMADLFRDMHFYFKHISMFSCATVNRIRYFLVIAVPTSTKMPRLQFDFTKFIYRSYMYIHHIYIYLKRHICQCHTMYHAYIIFTLFMSYVRHVLK